MLKQQKEGLIKLRKQLPLIFSLSRNDFKSKYASSQLGIIWAFIKPVVQAAVYIFVFSFVARSGAPSGSPYPYAFWLLPGMIAWFYFSEGVTSGMNALLDYSFLVKKVKFDIEILPLIKVISASFVHLFFVALVLVLYVLWGMPLSWTMVQLPYYMLCAFCLSSAFAKLNCAIVPFFRDFSQIMEIGLMVLMWACPVLWDISIMPVSLHFLFRLNPLYYLIDGYRQAFMNGGWFFQHPFMTLYFWAFVVVSQLFAERVFNHLSSHFADIM